MSTTTRHMNSSQLLGVYLAVCVILQVLHKLQHLCCDGGLQHPACQWAKLCRGPALHKQPGRHKHVQLKCTAPCDSSSRSGGGSSSSTVAACCLRSRATCSAGSGATDLKGVQDCSALGLQASQLQPHQVMQGDHRSLLRGRQWQGVLSQQRPSRSAGCSCWESIHAMGMDMQGEGTSTL